MHDWELGEGFITRGRRLHAEVITDSYHIRGYSGIMENRMEATIMGYIGVISNGQVADLSSSPHMLSPLCVRDHSLHQQCNIVLKP